uniref:Uncharacterized protein n=1 Tax=uncultured marine virus TaxID=186617 RepID=A0A0F7L5M1_9VIRU|nr:hypothetical protein [uncultured marine virus]
MSLSHESVSSRASCFSSKAFAKSPKFPPPNIFCSACWWGRVSPSISSKYSSKSFRLSLATLSAQSQACETRSLDVSLSGWRCVLMIHLSDRLECL